MAFQHGDVVLVPFPFTDLTAAKTWPAVVVSSDLYQQVRPDLLLAYVSSQVSQAHPILDYLLQDWAVAGLPRPSFFRPKVAAIEPILVAHQVGRLSARDLFEVDRRLRHAMAPTATALSDVISEVDFTAQPAAVVQTLAEKSLAAAVAFAVMNAPGANIARLQQALGESQSIP